jgi:glucose/arabinose dehydrogenase
MKSLRNAAIGLGALALAGASTAAAAPAGPSAEAASTAARAPRLTVQTVMTGLEHPWDVTFLPSGAMLVTERDKERIWLRRPGGAAAVVAEQPPGMWHWAETGLMGIVADPAFAKNRHFYTCHGFKNDTVQDIRVVVWHLNDAGTHASRVRPVVTGIPSTTGYHGGCRLRFDRHGALYISTGDAKIGTAPQDLHSLAGKVLRVKRHTGRGLASNPFANAEDPDKRRIYTYGHRNPQGLALRPGRSMWSVEQGTNRDDEVNQLVAGGNYGWDPAPGYDEFSLMTDFDLPGPQIGARWSSGFPTIATSGASWLSDSRWGAWQGRLAVGVQKGTSLQVMHFSRAGKFLGVRVPARLDDDYGRLRSPQIGPDGALYITTDNGDGNDKVLRVVPHPR